MNITVSVLSAGAQAQIKALEARIAGLEARMVTAGRVEGPGSGRQLSALTKYGNQLQWTGRQLQYNFTLPLVIAGAAATKFALDNEKAFTRISKVYGDSAMAANVMENELKALQKAFVALSNHYGVHQSEVLNIAADWAAAGASGVALARGVEQTLRVMVLGEMEAAKATEALIAIQAQYNLSSAELMDTIAKLNVVENQTGISLQGLVEGFARAAGVARSTGVDVEHLAAMLAALVPTAGSAAQAGNALKTILSRIQAPTGEARQLLERMGIAVDGVAWKSANGAQKIEMLALKFHDLDDAQKGVVSATLASRYQINKFEALMDSVYKKVDNNVKTVGYYGRALEATAVRSEYLAQAERELQAVLESNPQKFKQIWVILENALADIIIPMIPVILMAATTIKNMVEAFRSLPPEVQKFITLGLLMLALFGPLLRYIGSTMTLVGELSWFLGLMGKALLAPITGMWSLAAAVGGFAASILGLPGKLIGPFGKMMGVLRRFGLSWALLPKMVIVALFAIGSATRAFLRLETKLFMWLAAWLPGSATRMMLALRLIYAKGLNALAAIALASGWVLRGIWGATHAFFLSLSALTFSGKLLAIWRVGLAGLEAAIYYWSVGAGTAMLKGFAVMRTVLTVFVPQLLLASMALFARFFPALAMTIFSTRIWTGGLALITAIFTGFGRGMMAALAGFAAMFDRVMTYIWYTLVPGIWRRGMILVAAFTRSWAVGMRVLMMGLSAGWAAAMAAGLAAGRSLWAIALAGWAAVTAAFARGMAALGALAAINWSRAFMSVWAAFMGAWPRLVALMRGFGTALVAAFSSPWVLAIAGVIAILAFFRKQIQQLINNIINYFNNLPPSVANAFAPLVRLFHQGVGLIIKAFNALPEGVRNALLAVIRIVHQAVLKVYELFSYLNPFARHSPSLVENVTNGMAEVRRQFATVTQISGPIKKAYADLKRFGQATAALAASNEAAKRAGDRATLGKFAPGALASYDALVADLKVLTPLMNRLSNEVRDQQRVVDGLKWSLDEANFALDVQQKKLDGLEAIARAASDSLEAAQQRLRDLANTPIEGMGAMEDQIFANEMAQKRLRLEMLRMDEAVGGIDDLRDKMSKLSGEIELLSGEQKALREGGAGSEILSQYDDQINALRQQQNGIQDTANEYQSLSKELERLQRQGEILDLEKSLQFDELTRQIDKAANAMQEMPFDEIMAGIQQANADIAKYTVEVQKANDAVAAQKAVVDAATAARDAIQARYDIEAAKLDVLKTKYDQVQEAVRDVTSALDEMTQAAEEAIRRQQDAAKGRGRGGGGGSPALDNFEGAAGGDFPDVGGLGGLGREGGLGDQSALIDEFTKDLAKKTGDMFAEFDIFGPIKRKWNQFTGWWKSNVNPAFSSAAGGIGEIWNNTAGNIDWTAPFKGVDWKGAFSNITDTVKDVFETAKKWGGAIWRLFRDDIIGIWNTIKEKFQKAVDEIGPELEKFKDEVGPISESFKSLWKAVKPVVAIIGGALLFALKMITSILSNVLGPALDIVISIIKGVVKVIRGWVKIITGVINGDWGQVWDGIKTVWSGVWDAIWGVLKGAWETIKGIVKGIVEGIVGFFTWLADELVGHSIVPDMVRDIIEWIKSLPSKAWNALKDFGSKILEKVKEAWKWWTETNLSAWKAIWDWLSGLGSKAWNALKDLVTKIKDRAKEAWDGFRTASREKWDAFTAWVRGLGAAVGSAIGGVISTLRSKGKEAMQNFQDGVEIIWGNVKAWFGGLGDRIKNSIGNTATLLYQAGKNLIQGLMDGIKSMLKPLSGVGGAVAKAVKDNFPYSPAKKGPFAGRGNPLYSGRSIGALMARGLRQQTGLVERAAIAVVRPMANVLGVAGATLAVRGVKGPLTGTMAGRVAHAEARLSGRASERPASSYNQGDGVKVFNFYGDLSFPNITDPDDADDFINNLENLAGRG